MASRHKTQVPCDRKGNPLKPNDIPWQKAMTRALVVLPVGAALVPFGLLMYLFLELPESIQGLRMVFGIMLFLGVAMIVVAIICNGIASGKQQSGSDAAVNNRKGLMLAVLAGVLMSLFYRFVVKGMDISNFETPAPGMLTPYSAIFIFSLGVLASNFLFNTLVMRYPFVGERVRYAEYFRGSLSTHLTGCLGGAIWCLGTAFSYIASGEAGPAVSYALGQGAPMIAAIWGVFVWKEFRGGGRAVNGLLALMFALFIGGLALIIAAGGN